MKQIPIDTKHLFEPLQEHLIDLLKSLDEDDWYKQTIAKKWKVKDVVSHILDTQLRVLSIQRDKYFGEIPPKINGHKDLVDWLNLLNGDWVKATHRLSPNVLILLLETTGKLVVEYYQSLDPWEEAMFSVAWAGETKSLNWMHLAREYTEYWHHQQQIREAVNKPGIMSKDLFFPFINTFFRGLPHTFKDVDAKEGSVIKTTVTSESGGTWYLIRKGGRWGLDLSSETPPLASVTIPINISWALFSKSIRPHEVMDDIQIEGDRNLGERVLNMVSVMA